MSLIPSNHVTPSKSRITLRTPSFWLQRCGRRCGLRTPMVSRLVVSVGGGGSQKVVSHQSIYHLPSLERSHIISPFEARHFLSWYGLVPWRVVTVVVSVGGLVCFLGSPLQWIGILNGYLNFMNPKPQRGDSKLSSWRLIFWSSDSWILDDEVSGMKK